MRIKLLNNNEVILKTKDKLCKEDIKVVVDDTNIKPENIKKDVSILGVAGTYEGSGSSEDISAEVSEYTNKIASLESAVASLETELANKASGGTGGGGTESTETCTIQITTRNSFNTIFYKSINGWKIEEVTTSTTISPICDSTVMVQQAGFYEAEISAGIILNEQFGTGFVYQVPNTPNETITINIIID